MGDLSNVTAYDVFKNEMKEAFIDDDDFVESLWDNLFKLLICHYSKPRMIKTTIDNYIKSRKVLAKYLVIIEVESPIPKTSDINDKELYQFVLNKKVAKKS